MSDPISVTIHRETPMWRLVETAAKLGIDFKEPVVITHDLTDRDVTIRQWETPKALGVTARQIADSVLGARLTLLEEKVDRIQEVLPSTRDPSESPSARSLD